MVKVRIASRPRQNTISIKTNAYTLSNDKSLVMFSIVGVVKNCPEKTGFCHANITISN
jgi:hypothetical protein